MSDMRANRRERRLRYLRGLRGEKKGVSPVVATLILILIAVAAAAALYLWLVAWQGNITGGIGQPGAQYTVKVGGSTSVFPFSNLAATWFDQNNSDVVVADSQGGTGAGMLAVCEGHIDVGQASSPQTVSGLQSGDGCPSSGQITITTVAYDAVDVILPSANPMGILSMNESILLGIYLSDSTTAPATLMPAYLTGAGWTSGTPVAWTKVPTTANCVLPPTAYPGTCAFSADVATSHAYMRSDTSGTTQTFTARLLGISGTAPVTSLVANQANYGGCGSDGQLASCSIAVTGENGNPAVISAVAHDPTGIGYASDGLARTAGSGVAIIPFAAIGQTVCLSGTSCTLGSVTPTLGSSGTIAAGITSSTTVTNYIGWRPFEFVTLNPPTGEVQRYIEFITDPANNIELATVTSEISIYSV